MYVFLSTRLSYMNVVYKTTKQNRDSLLHPLRIGLLIIGQVIHNTAVKIHFETIPEWTKWIA